MGTFIRDIDEIVENLEKEQRNCCQEINDLQDVLAKFAKAAEKKLGIGIDNADIGTRFKDKFGFLIKSIVLKPQTGQEDELVEPVFIGDNVHGDLRENILPNINMSHLIFSPNTEIHRASFYIAKDNIEVLNKLIETPPSQALLMTYEEAVPNHIGINKWLDTWKDKGQADWKSDQIREECLLNLRQQILSNKSEFEKHALKSIVKASKIFSGAQKGESLSCLKLHNTHQSREDVLWGYIPAYAKDKWHDMHDHGSIAFPDVSPMHLWWNMYMAKCAINTDQYALFCSNPSSKGNSFAGIVIICDISKDCGDIQLSLMAIDLIAKTLLSCVDRMTLEYIQNKRSENNQNIVKAEERIRQHIKMVQSFGHDGKQPATTIATLLTKDWKCVREVATLLANSLKERLVSYSRLSTAFEDSEKAREILKEEVENTIKEGHTYFKSVSDVFFEEAIGLFGKLAVDDSGRDIADKLWGEQSRQKVFEHVMGPLIETTYDNRSSLYSINRSTVINIIHRMKQFHICVSCENHEYLVPNKLSGDSGKPTTPLLISVLHFVLSELLTNTLKYQWSQIVTDIVDIHIKLTISTNDSEVFIRLLCTPGYDPSTVLSSNRVTGLTSLKLALQACGAKMCEQELYDNYGTIGYFPWPDYVDGSTVYTIGPFSKSAFYLQQGE